MNPNTKEAYPQWGIKEVFIFSILSYLLTFIFPLVLGLLNFDITLHALVLWSNIVFMLFEFLIVFFYLTYILKLNYIDSIKLNKPPNFSLIWCLIIASGMSVFAKINNFLAPRYTIWASQVIEEIKVALQTEGQFLFLYIIMMLFIAPFFEEVFWRGFAYPAFRKRYSALASIVLVSTLFVIIHIRKTGISFPAILNIFMGSIVLCTLREFTKSTLPCILTHFFYNLGLLCISLFNVIRN